MLLDHRYRLLFRFLPCLRTSDIVDVRLTASVEASAFYLWRFLRFELQSTLCHVSTLSLPHFVFTN